MEGATDCREGPERDQINNDHGICILGPNMYNRTHTQKTKINLLILVFYFKVIIL